ncbi:MAG: hypothetical protein WBG32_09060 [Nodosilinea sp.]
MAIVGSVGLRSQRLRRQLVALQVSCSFSGTLGRLAISLGLGLLSAGLTSCRNLTPVVPRQIVLKQSWEIEAGDRVAGQLVTGSLGDISIRLRGTRLRAPFAGQVELAAKGFYCIYFSTPEVPAYLFRYCGVRQPRLGLIQAGEVMGHGQQIHFATLRRQPDGSWAIVEPSDRVLEQSLNQPPPALRF